MILEGFANFSDFMVLHHLYRKKGVWSVTTSTACSCFTKMGLCCEFFLGSFLRGASVNICCQLFRWIQNWGFRNSEQYKHTYAQQPCTCTLITVRSDVQYFRIRDKILVVKIAAIRFNIFSNVTK